MLLLAFKELILDTEGLVAIETLLLWLLLYKFSSDGTDALVARDLVALGERPCFNLR